MQTKIFCLEGITGAGKTTQANLIGEYLRRGNNSYLVINEKEYEPFRQTIICWHINGANQNFTQKEIINIARVREETHKIHFNSLLGQIDYLLFDRNFFTSAIYQTSNEWSLEKIIAINTRERTLVPERGVVLICDPQIARRRIDERRKKVNKYKLPSMHETVEEISKRRELYIELARLHPELYLVDTTYKAECEVFEEIKSSFGLER